MLVFSILNHGYDVGISPICNYLGLSNHIWNRLMPVDNKQRNLKLPDMQRTNPDQMWPKKAQNLSLFFERYSHTLASPSPSTLQILKCVESKTDGDILLIFSRTTIIIFDSWGV